MRSCYIYILFALIIGSSLRVGVYLQNRSFIIDEANLARNIVEKDYADFFKPLDYEQYSPPLFSCALKTMTSLFGVNEYSLTFLSLLAGIVSLVLLFLIARLLDIEAIPILYILLLYGLSTLAIRYSTELKQYSLDAFLYLLFLYWIVKKGEKEFNLSYTLQLIFFGAFAIWTSMPIVFVLAAMGVLFLYRSLKLKLIKIPYLILIGSTWLMSFAIYFILILKSDAGSDYLQNFHSRYFFNFFPTNLSSLNQSGTLLLGVFRSISDKTTVSLVGTFLFFGIGSYQLFKHKKSEACLLLLPFLFCLIASHFGMYSLLPRLTLFLIAPLTLVFGYGFSWCWKYSNKYLKIVLLTFVILTLVNKEGYQHFWKSMEFEDSKTTLTYLYENRSKDEPIFVYYSRVPAFVFYNEMHDAAFNLNNYYLCEWGELLGTAIRNNKELQSGDKFWVFSPDIKSVEISNKDFQSVQKITNLIEEETAVQSIVQHYIMK